MDPICTVCRQHEETTRHILWECPLARNVWALVRGRIQKTSSSEASFFLLTRQMMERLSGKEFEIWAMTAWAIWTARNRIHFQHTAPSKRDPQASNWPDGGNTRNWLKILCKGRKLDASFVSLRPLMKHNVSYLIYTYFIVFWLVFVEAIGHAAWLHGLLSYRS